MQKSTADTLVAEMFWVKKNKEILYKSAACNKEFDILPESDV